MSPEAPTDQPASDPVAAAAAPDVAPGDGGSPEVAPAPPTGAPPQPDDTASEPHFLKGLTSIHPDVRFLVLVGLVIAATGLSLLLSTVGSRTSDVDIVAGLVPGEGDTWSLRGRVLKKGLPLKNATVWAIAKDAKGNRDAPPSATTDPNGSFQIGPVPKKITDRVEEVTMFAQGASSWFSSAEQGEETLTVGSGGLRRARASGGWLLFFIPLIFVASAISPFLGAIKDWKYTILLIFTVGLTASVIAGVSISLKAVQTQADKDETVSLGFASLFRGRYVEGTSTEWVLSLTAPPPREAETVKSAMPTPPVAAPPTTGAPPAGAAAGGAAPDPKKPAEDAKKPADGGPPTGAPAAGPVPTAVSAAKVEPALPGFGAPLWVLLLAVIGSGLMTVSLIVSEIKDRPDFSKGDEARKRVEKIVRHQFFILFSPLSAIFVYQMLVAANTATQPLAVALAVLGAGPVLNALLDKAVTAAQSLVSG